MNGSSVFLTGGGGFLGRALMRDIGSLDWTAYSRDEHKLRIVESRYGARTISGDIGDYERLKLAMRGHDYVIHAAASKYVDRGETHPEEVAQTNVTGTLNVIRAAEAVGIKRMVVISTDKAVQPRNAYGLSKALCEYLALRSNVPTVVARYGNVLRSTGSVVERWMALPETTPLTVTNPDMTRFWMTVRAAATLVYDALWSATAYSILVPDLMSASILELARACAGEREIIVKGERLGEKVHETLLSEEERHYATPYTGDLALLVPPYSLRSGAIGPAFRHAITSDTAKRWDLGDLAKAIREPLP